jgi:hypothetical protein
MMYAYHRPSAYETVFHKVELPEPILVTHRHEPIPIFYAGLEYTVGDMKLVSSVAQRALGDNLIAALHSDMKT